MGEMILENECRGREGRELLDFISSPRKSVGPKLRRQQAFYGDTSCDFYNNSFVGAPAATKRNGGLRGSTATRSRR